MHPFVLSVFNPLFYLCTFGSVDLPTVYQQCFQMLSFLLPLSLSFALSLSLSQSSIPLHCFLKLSHFFIFVLSLSLSLSLSYLVWAFKIKILVLWSVCTQQCLTVTVFSALSLCSILFLPVFISSHARAFISLYLFQFLPFSIYLLPASFSDW